MQHFDQDVLAACAEAREVELTTWGRTTGKPHVVTIWTWGGGERLYVRAGGGLARDWPQNLLANGRGILHVAGREIPVAARQVTDPAEARAGAAWIRQKYGMDTAPSPEGGPLTPAEQATFELLPDEGASL